MPASYISCAVLPPEAWAEAGGYAVRTHLSEGVSAMDLYLDEGLSPLWRIEAVRYAAPGERKALVVDARDAAVASLGFPLPDGRIDEAFYPFSRRGDLMFEDPYWLSWFDRYGPFGGTTADGALRVCFDDAARGRFLQPVFFVGSRGNWSHWLLDFASRLQFWEAHPEKDALTPVFGPLSALHRKTLAVFGIDAERCASLPVLPGRLNLVEGERIVVPQLPPKEFAYPYVRGKFARWRAEDTGLPNRLYLTRRRLAPRHRIANDAAVAACLEKRGFHTLSIEALDFSTQMDVLTRARLVVMPFGGDMGNVAVCQPGCVIVLLVSHAYASQTPIELLRREVIRFVFASGLPTVVVYGRPRDPGDAGLDALADYDLTELSAAIDRAEDLLNMRAGEEPRPVSLPSEGK